MATKHKVRLALLNGMSTVEVVATFDVIQEDKMMHSEPDRQSLAWAHGVVSVEALGGMIGPTAFVLPDGRAVSPFHIAPWFAETPVPGLPAILQRLRGEWPCVPFGADAPRRLPPAWRATAQSATVQSFAGAGVPHGHASNVEWHFAPQGLRDIALICDYPEDHPIKSLHRTVRPDPAAPALDLSLTVTARRPCRLPLGLHPTFRLPANGCAQLIAPDFRQGRVFPTAVEPSSLLLPDALFQSLDAVPTLTGQPLSLSHLPLATMNEELVQLCGVTGDFVLRYPDEGFQLRLSWNTSHFPSVLLWVSNRGRTAAPWNSRHLALGVEPVCSAFDLGPAISNADNPISRDGTATTMVLTPDRDFTTAYRIAVEPLEQANGASPRLATASGSAA